MKKRFKKGELERMHKAEWYYFDDIETMETVKIFFGIIVFFIISPLCFFFVLDLLGGIIKSIIISFFIMLFLVSSIIPEYVAYVINFISGGNILHSEAFGIFQYCDFVITSRYDCKKAFKENSDYFLKVHKIGKIQITKKDYEQIKKCMMDALYYKNVIMFTFLLIQ